MPADWPTPAQADQFDRFSVAQRVAAELTDHLDGIARNTAQAHLSQQLLEDDELLREKAAEAGVDLPDAMR